MSNYTKATDFAVKDGLLTGNPSKIIKGTEIDDEFNAIAVAVATKADTVSPTFTGTPLAPTAAGGTNTTQIATTAFVTAATTTERTATATLTNKTISADNNTISGIAASSFVLSNASGNIDGSASQKAIPSGAVVGTTDTQTLTNKTISGADNTINNINGANISTGNIAAARIVDALNASGSAPIYACRAWVNFDGTGTFSPNPSTTKIRASGNVSSITDNGTGNYTINFTTAMPDANYCVSGWCSRADGTMVTGDSTTPPTTTSVTITTVNDAGGDSDCSFVTVAIHR